MGTGTVDTADRLGLLWVFLCFFMCVMYVNFVHVLFYLGELSHFPSCFGVGVTNLNEPPSSFLLPPITAG